MNTSKGRIASRYGRKQVMAAPRGFTRLGGHSARRRIHFIATTDWNIYYRFPTYVINASRGRNTFILVHTPLASQPSRRYRGKEGESLILKDFLNKEVKT